MQSVTSEYLTAITANERTMVSQVEIALVDNETIGAAIAVTADEGHNSVVPKESVVDNVKSAGTRRYAIADPYAAGSGDERVFPGEDLYPCTGSAGWFGNSLSDANGDISGGETLELDYGGPVDVRTLRWWANSYLGIPVDFVVSYSTDGVGWTVAESVTGNSAESWDHDLGAITEIYKLKIVITKVNHPTSFAKLLEFEAGLTVDVSDRIKSWEILSEREHDGQSLPIGNASINKLTLYLDNVDGVFYRNSGSLYAPYLVANRKITVWEGVTLADGTTEMLQQGVFYSRVWEAGSRDTTVKVVGWDRGKRMSEEDYATSTVLEDKTISELVTILATAFGLDPSDMVIDTTSGEVAYSWFESGSYFNHLKTLAAGEGGTFYIDEMNRLTFENREHLASKTTSVVTLTDIDDILSATEGWDQARMRNRIVVPVRPLTLGSTQEIYSYQETVTVPAGDTKSLTVYYAERPAMNVQTPVFSGGAHITIQSWTAYAWGGTLVFTNSGGSDETVTSITIDGDPLQELGGVRAVRENATSIGLNGKRTYTLSDAAAQYMQDLSVAETLAEDLRDSLSDPGSEITVSMPGRPELQLADRITAQHERLSLDGDYWITRMRKLHDGAFRMETTLLEVV
ncbi:MAG: hypothetical protein HN413_08055 [Chloroflexi bacterium]|jgi:hypothetical protein|nr:hypothetical protein [Chloroflexota bacterium]